MHNKNRVYTMKMPYKKFLEEIKELQNKGMSEKEIAYHFGLSTFKLRIQKAFAKKEVRAKLEKRAKRLRARGYSLRKSLILWVLRTILL